MDRTEIEQSHKSQRPHNVWCRPLTDTLITDTVLTAGLNEHFWLVKDDTPQQQTLAALNMYIYHAVTPKTVNFWVHKQSRGYMIDACTYVQVCLDNSDWSGVAKVSELERIPSYLDAIQSTSRVPSPERCPSYRDTPVYSYNTTASTWTLATPRTTWESKVSENECNRSLKKHVLAKGCSTPLPPCSNSGSSEWLQLWKLIL